MENRTDRRVLRSRRLIVAAFERLLETRPYERIGVSAIAQEADIDRKTFYQHYRSVDGLLGAIADDFAAGVLDEVEQAAPADPCPGERERAGSLAFALGGIFSLLQNLLADEPARPAAEVERMAVTLTESGLLGMLDA